ncbi:MAG: ABC transporter permease [Bacteroidota bacterium]
MYKLFLKIATRYLFKNKQYSFINTFGLSIGIASFVLIMLYVNYEYGYDKFDGSEYVHRVYMDYTEEGVFVPGDAQTYNLSGPTLKQNFPEIEHYVRLGHITDVAFKYNNSIFDGEKGAVADASFLNVFNYPLLKGDKAKLLTEPFTIILTESLANKIFGEKNPMGETLSVFYNGEQTFTVEGVLKDFPENIHMKNNFLISYSTILTWKGYPDNPEPNWNGNNLFTYIKLNKDTHVAQLKKKIMDFKVEALPFERHNLEALEDIHLYSDKPYEAEANGSANRVRFLFAIALIIIFLSWLNYVNLSTAKSLERAKETGIRKVAGAQRSQIILQSLSESLLLNIIAISAAIIVVLIALPFFNNYVGKELNIGMSNLYDFIPFIVFIFLGAIISGIYPAFVLSNFSPARALKGKIQNSGTGLVLRKILIIGQLMSTIVLLVGTIVVTKQINYLKNQPIGTNLNQVVAIKGKIMGNKSDSLKRNHILSLKSEYKDLTFVDAVALSQTYPGGDYSNLSSSVGVTYPNGERNDTRIWYNYRVEPSYFELMNLEFVAGGPFIENSKGFSNRIVLNQSFVDLMGLSNMDEVIDGTMKFFGEEWVVSGVIKDYHHFGLKTAIEPMLFLHRRNFNELLVKLDQKSLSLTGLESAISQIETKWRDRFPETTFGYTFLDENFEAQYKEEKAFGSAFQIFTLLSILIAFMGLYGLTSYSCLQRKKEIGIRKVNGATITQILRLLNQDFVSWLGLAFVLAVPISWYVMNRWLQDFAYKTTISLWVFLLAGIVVMAILLFTVSWKSLQAASANPVDTLRDE